MESEIRAAGFDVEGVGSEAEALRRLEHEPRPTCVCVDVHGLAPGFFGRLPLWCRSAAVLLIEAWRGTHRRDASPFSNKALIEAVHRSQSRRQLLHTAL